MPRTTATSAAIRSATSRARLAGWSLPNLQRTRARATSRRWTASLRRPRPSGAWGLMIPRSAGKDSTTGHWEIAGVHLSKPFPTYPNGFPPAVVEEFARRTGRGVIGNVAGSGTAVLERLSDRSTSERVRGFSTRPPIRSFRSRRTKASFLSPSCIGRARSRARCSCRRTTCRASSRGRSSGEPGAYERTKNRRDYSIAAAGRDAARCARGGRNSADWRGKGRRPFRRTRDQIDAYGDQQRRNRGDLDVAWGRRQMGYCSRT